MGSLPHPVELFAAFRDLPYPALLDSAMPNPKLARYSYLAADPFLTMVSREREVTVAHRDDGLETGGDPFEVLRDLLRTHRMEPAPGGPGLPPFQGGAIGYLGYDLGRLLERLPATARSDLPLPDVVLSFYDWVVAHDNVTGQTTLFSTGLPQRTEARARERVEWVRERLHRASPPTEAPEASLASPVTSNFGREEYLDAIRRVQRYLEAGDVYQVNVSQRLEAAFRGDPWALYRRLRQANPAPFAAYLSFPQASVLSLSPEQFLCVDGSRVETRPIKGTRPRGKSEEEDRRLARELLASDKEMAENLMIVDLLRNDLGRVCRIGSVKVPLFRALERHPAVWHTVSTVTGELAAGRDVVDLLRAAFPGGSVTGAPKIRAMQIIEELEPVRRGVYCGSIGCFSFSGVTNTSIVIRTILVAGERLYLQVGGAVMADSDPEAEYNETLHKAEGLLRVL